MSIGDRFWKKVRRAGPDECWPWTAATSGYGHGRFKIGGKLYSAHRVAYVLAGGEIPESRMHRSYHGAVVRHTCDNPACCNPSHLETGEQIDNVRDMMERGRHRYARSGTVATPADCSGSKADV